MGRWREGDGGMNRSRGGWMGDWSERLSEGWVDVERGWSDE